jgi:hypothetical protein
VLQLNVCHNTTVPCVVSHLSFEAVADMTLPSHDLAKQSRQGKHAGEVFRAPKLSENMLKVQLRPHNISVGLSVVLCAC